MPNLNDLAIVVCSCDKYRSVWDPYFRLLYKYFPSIPQNIFLLTESTAIPWEESSVWFDNTCGVHVINSSEKIWSKRLKDSLQQVDYKYILFLLEDFFLQDFVHTDSLEKIVGWMSEDDNIAAVRIYPFWEAFTNNWPKYKDSFFVIDRNYEERVNAQATIWRKDRFIEILDDKESAWQFEILASNRSRIDPYLYLGYYEPIELKGIFPYQIAQANGYGITSGKWLWNTPKLFQKNGILCQFSDLGIMSEKEWTFHYKSKVYRWYRRSIKLIHILRNKIINKESINMQAILDSSMMRTSFQLLSEEEYRTHYDRDLMLINRNRQKYDNCI